MKKQDFNKDHYKNLLSSITPSRYNKLSKLHKYWGKKPVEVLNAIINMFTDEDDIILDPFLGTGLISKESLKINRRFIGIDINPFSIRYANFINNLPHSNEYKQAVDEIESELKDIINSSYMTSNNNIISHVLWNGNKIEKIWKKENNRKIELNLSEYIEYSNNNYYPRNIRDVKLFNNSRINTNNKMTINDLISNRNLKNIDLLLDVINSKRLDIRESLLFTLTSSIGQMSNMVFCIENRKGKKKKSLEVGSWAIGYWKPKRHFELNVWNYFFTKCKMITKILEETDDERRCESSNCIDNFFKEKLDLCLINNSNITTLKKIPDNSIRLIVTDPPHGNRIPYLELSELWNSVFNHTIDFEKEIVVSEAKDRDKEINNFTNDMKLFIDESIRILKDDGFFVLIYNSKMKKYWSFLENIENKGLLLLYEVPLKYSANSIVQNNRNGALIDDICLVYQKI